MQHSFVKPPFRARLSQLPQLVFSCGSQSREGEQLSATFRYVYGFPFSLKIMRYRRRRRKGATAQGRNCAEARRRKGAKAQGRKGAKVQRRKGAKAQRRKGAYAQRFRGAKVQRRKGPKAQRSTGSKAQRSLKGAKGGLFFPGVEDRHVPTPAADAINQGKTREKSALFAESSRQAALGNCKRSL